VLVGRLLLAGEDSVILVPPSGVSSTEELSEIEGPGFRVGRNAVPINSQRRAERMIDMRSALVI